MDLQFVWDPYACAVYILSHITKGQRGMSKLLETTSEEANSDIVNKVNSDIVKKVVTKFVDLIFLFLQCQGL